MDKLDFVIYLVITISFATFVALFGSLPVLRNTPVAFLHRCFWVHIPNAFLALDKSLFAGRGRLAVQRGWGYLFYENHPIILIFFIALLSVSECMFLPAAWPYMHPGDKLWGSVAVALPYVFIYLCVASDSTITRVNHAEKMRLYPYDRVLFHPGQICRTCKFLKPPRSKHCRTCNVCVSRHDHHCVWLKGCMAENSYRFFVALLSSLSVLLTYAVYVGHYVLDASIQKYFLIQTHGQGVTTPHWSTNLSILERLNHFGAAISDNIDVGSITLLCLLSLPLAAAMLVYHIYLIWAGTTTSETSKWEDWGDDLKDKAVFIARKSEIYRSNPAIEPPVSWPVSADQTLVYTKGGSPPRVGYTPANGFMTINQPREDAPEDPRWERLRSMKEVVNVYDLGFWGNVRDILGVRRWNSG